MRLANKKGQGLIEYLILVALMAVATIGVVRALNYAVQTRFANTIYAIHGSKKRVKTESFDESSIKKRDLSDFMNGAAQGNEQ
jgi:pilus assembly protein Flp/PilA